MSILLVVMEALVKKVHFCDEASICVVALMKKAPAQSGRGG
jgi:hypothetical protein